MERPKGKLRLLCLHGKRQTGDLFATRLKRLVPKLRRLCVELVFVDAPHELELDVAAGQTAAVRAWWTTSGSVEEEIRAVQIVERAWWEHAPLHGVLGFSQGAALAGLVASQPRHRFPGISFAIVAGGFLALAQQQQKSRDRGAFVDLPSLHFLGLADELVVPARSRSLADAFSRAVVVEHEKGHVFPTQGKAIEQVLEFCSGCRGDVAWDSASEAALVWSRGRLSGAGTVAAAAAAAADSESEDCAEEQAEELDALVEIFGDGKVTVLRRRPPLLRISLCEEEGTEEGEGEAEAELYLSMPALYPETDPLGVVSCFVKRAATSHFCRDPEIETALRKTAAESVGDGACAYAIAMECVELLGELEFGGDRLRGEEGGGDGDGGGGGVAAAASAAASASNSTSTCSSTTSATSTSLWKVSSEEETARMVKEATRLALAFEEERGDVDDGRDGDANNSDDEDHHAQAARGIWNYTVGLVGKPSAGKSTFFNAAAVPGSAEAAMGAFPFTTLSPNMAMGEYEVETPRGLSVDLQPTSSIARVTLMDVAGLVPGAYEGRGKGNQFLNDLTAADVLIHVVDASGETDAQGNVGGSGGGGGSGSEAETFGSPAHDIEWVSEEVHRWVFNNVAAQWGTVVKKGMKRLFALVTGYGSGGRSVAHNVRLAIKRMGKRERDPRTWSEIEVHEFVAHFIRVRWPTLIALNKMDRGEVAEQGARDVARAFPSARVQKVSAKFEVEKKRWERRGWVDDNGMRTEEGMAKVGKEEVRRAYAANREWNVAKAVARAVEMKPPTYVWVVDSLGAAVTAATATAGAGGARLGAPIKLPPCLCFKPASTPEDVLRYRKQKGMQSGDFVRAECINLAVEGGDIGARATRVVRKDEIIAEGRGNVLCIATNKKTRWQGR